MKKKASLFIGLMLCLFSAFAQDAPPTPPPDTTKPKVIERALGDVIYTKGELTYLEGTRVVIECGYVKTFHGFINMNGNDIFVYNDKKDIKGTLLRFVELDTCDNARIVIDKAATKGIITVNATTAQGYAVALHFGIAVKVRGAVDYWLISQNSIPGKSFSLLPLERERVLKFEKVDW